MKTIMWKIILTDDNRIASLENASNLSLNSVESQLVIIGLLENLKQRHLDRLKTLFQKTVKSGDEDAGL